MTADVEFARVVRGDADGGPERRIPTLLHSARAALVTLGLERRTKDVSDLGYADTRNLDGLVETPAAKEHRRLRQLYETLRDRLAESLEEEHPGLLSSMRVADQHEWLRRRLAETLGPVVKRLEAEAADGSA